MIRRRYSLLIACGIACFFKGESAPAIIPVVQETETDPAAKKDANAENIKADQDRLANEYRLLEDKLFSLFEFEQDSNPARAELLRRAFLQSQENMTVIQLKSISELLERSKLKDAELEQEQVVLQLKQLLDLLQSEDRGKRVHDEIQRHQEYLKEIERLIRIQKGIRGQTEGGTDARRLARSQEQAIERTDRLARKIAENESRPAADSIQNPDSEPANSQQNAGPSKQSSPDAPNSPAVPSGDSKPAEQDSEKSEADQQAPTRQRVESAEQRMRDARRKLESANRDGASEEMAAAERELERAKQDLEEILRQLREEEVERSLAMLETRFRKMLERQVRIHDTTKNLDRVQQKQRDHDFQIATGRLANDQREIAVDASRSLILLKEDGSSVAFPVTVENLRDDMLEVATGLSAANTGPIILELEESIIDTLNYLIKSLVQTQKDLAKMKRNQKQPTGAPGDQPLVDQLAEIKMMRGLQEQIHNRHQRYAKFLRDPNDPIGISETAEIQSALDRLAKRQTQLADIARDIVSEKNQ